MRNSLVLMGWLLLCVPTVIADILRVPEEYPSVLEATDAAVPGDSVLVQPGTWDYTEIRVSPSGIVTKIALVTKPGLTVVGLGGSGNTILDAGGETETVTVVVGHWTPGAEPTRIVGFTITGGGTGVSAGHGAPPLDLSDCRVVDNTRLGISHRDMSIRLSGCYLAGNGLDLSGSIVAIQGFDSNLDIENTVFEHDVPGTFGLWMPGSDVPGLSLRLSGCTFRDLGVGADLYTVDDLLIENCLFERCGTLGGLRIAESSGTIRFNTFAFDSAGWGGGAKLNDCNILVENNTFYRCHSQDGAALGIAFQDGGVRNNIFAYCTGSGAAASFGGGPQHSDTGCNLFWQNEGGNYEREWLPAPTDLEADPEFCNEPTLDLTLRSTSPAAPANNPCGLLGAWDVQCGPVSIAPTSWGRLKNLYREVEP